MINSIIIPIIFCTVFCLNSFAQKTGWEVVQSNTTENLNSIYFFDHQVGIACGNSGVMLKSVDSGKTWQSLQSPLTTNLNDCFMFEKDCFLSIGDSGMGLVTWGGDTLTIGDLSNYGVDIYCVAFSRSPNYSYGVFGASSQTILKSNTTYCATVIYDAYSGPPGSFLGAYMLTDKLGFVAGENSISQPIVGRSTDYGSAFDYVSFYLDGNEGRATGVAFTDSSIGYISARVWDGRGAIAKTIDNGDTWTTTFFSNPLHSINFPISGTSQIGYCIGDSGTILKTFDAGGNWYHQITGSNENLNKVFFLDQNFGFAVGENGVILRTTNGGGPVTSVNNDFTPVHKFELHQNYPNPFNPSTKIKYSIPQSSQVTIKIFDILGNEIETLVNEEKSAGDYEITWNASHLPSGFYIYEFIAGEFINAKKMLLIK